MIIEIKCDSTYKSTYKIYLFWLARGLTIKKWFMFFIRFMKVIKFLIKSTLIFSNMVENELLENDINILLAKECK